MRGLIGDFRSAARSLRRAPASTLIVVITIAFGVAFVGTTFSFINTRFFRPFPFPAAGRIVSPAWIDHSSILSATPLPLVEAIRRDAKSFDRVVALQERSRILAPPGGAPFAIGVTAVDTGVLALIDARVQRGRLISREEIRERTPVAIISDSLWRTVYQSAESIVGATLALDGATYQIVGVAARGLRFYQRSDVIVPLDESDDAEERYIVLGRLRDGRSRESARAEFDQLHRRVGSADTRFAQWRIFRVGEMFDRRRGIPATALWTFLALAACVLLIACTNVANLLLMRAAERRTEMAVRASLGASRWRLIRLGLVESVALGTVAGAVGILFTFWGNQLLGVVLPLGRMPTWMQWGVDLRVAAFLIALTVIVVAAIGVTPALEGSRFDLVRSLRAGGDSVIGKTHTLRAGQQGIVIQSAVAFALCICAALLWRSYSNMRNVDLGFDGVGLIRASVMLPSTERNDAERSARFYESLALRLASDPRVSRIAVVGPAGPLKGDTAASATTEQWGLYVGGAGPLDRTIRPPPSWHAVSDSYFDVMGIRLVRGRAFDASTQRGSEPVALVSQAAARALFGHDDPIGKTFRFGGYKTYFTVIGVVSDTRMLVSRAWGLTPEALPILYMSEKQVTTQPSMLVRGTGDLDATRALIRAVSASIDPQAAPGQLSTVAESQGETAMLMRIMGQLIAVFGLAGLLLAMVGTYGVIAYAVTQRTREIGLRVALGGTPTQVLRGFVGDGMRETMFGLVVGVVLAAISSQLTRGWLLGVKAIDVPTYLAVVLFFVAVALVSCYLPARRVTRIDPMRALRSD